MSNDDTIPFGSNTVFKTTLAVHGEKLKQSEKTNREVIDLFEKRRIETDKAIQQIREHVERIHDDAFMHTNDRIDELEAKFEKRISETLRKIEQYDKEIKHYVDNYYRLHEERIRTISERAGKMSLIDSTVGELKKKVENLEHWKWYIAGMGVAMSVYAMYQNFFKLLL
jgi:thiamine kinase-like enzyme